MLLGNLGLKKLKVLPLSMQGKNFRRRHSDFFFPESNMWNVGTIFLVVVLCW